MSVERERASKIFFFIKYYQTEPELSPHIELKEVLSVSFHTFSIAKESEENWDGIKMNQPSAVNACMYVSEFIERMNKQMCASMNANVVSIWTGYESSVWKLYWITFYNEIILVSLSPSLGCVNKGDVHLFELFYVLFFIQTVSSFSCEPICLIPFYFRCLWYQRI